MALLRASLHCYCPLMLTMLHLVMPLLQVGSKLGELLPSLITGASIASTFNVGAGSWVVTRHGGSSCAPLLGCRLVLVCLERGFGVCCGFCMFWWCLGAPVPGGGGVGSAYLHPGSLPVPHGVWLEDVPHCQHTLMDPRPPHICIALAVTPFPPYPATAASPTLGMGLRGYPASAQAWDIHPPARKPWSWPPSSPQPTAQGTGEHVQSRRLCVFVRS